MPSSSWMSAIGVEPEMSYEEVARAIGISRVRVMQLEKSALRKLRRLCGQDEQLDQVFKVVRRCDT